MRPTEQHKPAATQRSPMTDTAHTSNIQYTENAMPLTRNGAGKQARARSRDSAKSFGGSKWPRGRFRQGASAAPAC